MSPSTANCCIFLSSLHIREDRRVYIKSANVTCFSYDHPHILAGQGTMGLEIIEQVPDLDACIIPVGGGGLIAGSAVAIKTLRPNVKIYVSSLTHLTLNKLSPNYILEESNFNFRYVRLCDLDVPKEQWLNCL